MGFSQNELAQMSCQEAVAELRQDHKNGLLTEELFEAAQAETVDHYHPKYSAPIKIMPSATQYIPDEGSYSVTGLGSEFAIDPETGQILGLTPEAIARMTVEADTSGSVSTGTGKRFPSGAAIVIGFSKAGKLINKLLTLGAATAEPYRKAAYIARKTVAKGGFAFYGQRTAGYELHDADTGQRWDGISAKPERLELRPARDRMIGKRQVVGVGGPKGLSLIDASTMMPPSPQQIIEFYVWLQACNEKEAAARLAAFSLKPKISKRDAEAAREVGMGLSGNTPYNERDFLVRFANGQSRKLNMATREVELVTERILIGGCGLDCSLPHTPTGMPFRIYWQALRLATEEMGVDSFDGVSYDFGGAKPTDPEGCLKHAQVLAVRTAGPSCVQHVTWVDADGEHTITRSDALRNLSDQDEDEYLNEVRANYRKGMDPESYAQDLVEALDNTSGSTSRHNRDDEWWVAHEVIRECNDALLASEATDAEDVSQEMAEARAKVAKTRGEAEAVKLKAMRKLMPEYVKPGEILTKGPRREVDHNWTTQGNKKDMSKRGGTSDKRKRAENKVTRNIRFK